MKLKTQDTITNSLAIAAIGSVLILTIIRLFYGAELTDEAYAVAESYMVSKGALPFVNNWSQMPGFTLLLSPFAKIYTAVAGGTDGIILFFRFVSFSLNLLTALAVSFVFRKQVDNKVLLILFPLIYVGASGWDYVAFRGDSMAIDLMAIGVPLIAVYYCDNKDSLIAPLLSGFLLALSVLSYPTFAFEVFYFVIAILVLSYRNKRGYRFLGFFILGGAIATILVVGYLAINSSIADIFFIISQRIDL